MEKTLIRVSDARVPLSIFLEEFYDPLGVGRSALFVKKTLSTFLQGWDFWNVILSSGNL